MITPFFGPQEYNPGTTVSTALEVIALENGVSGEGRLALFGTKASSIWEAATTKEVELSGEALMVDVVQQLGRRGMHARLVARGDSAVERAQKASAAASEV